MKTKLLSFLLTVILIASVPAHDSYAMEVSEENIYASEEVEENIYASEEVEAFDIKFSKSQLEEKTDILDAKEKTCKLDINDIEKISDELQYSASQNKSRAASTVYYGTISGFLTQTDEYTLYPTTLSAGDYLQVKVTMPSDAQIDYDLLLFDSSLSMIKSSDYVTCFTSSTPTLEESLGYQAESDEKVYVCVYSVSGGSSTEAYTLDYTITKDHDDSTEPNENAKEAALLNLGVSGSTINGKINSPLDNDWYVFNVEDSPTYDKVRLFISSSSSVNGCNIEIYRNLIASNYYAMQFLGSGTGGDIELAAGTYYLRIVSTNTFDNFNAADIPDYELSVVPVSRVDEITISNLSGYLGTFVSYDGPKTYRIEEKKDSNHIVVTGVAYYIDENNEKHRAVNAKINGKVIDEQWKQINRPDMDTVYGSAITDSNGIYRMNINLNTALGGLTYSAPVSTHYYDLMTVTTSANNIYSREEQFYYLKFCSYTGV